MLFGLGERDDPTQIGENHQEAMQVQLGNGSSKFEWLFQRHFCDDFQEGQVGKCRLQSPWLILNQRMLHCP